METLAERFANEWNRIAPWLMVILAVCATPAFSQAVPAVTGDARVDNLLSQMTLQEKLTLVHGTAEDRSASQGQAGYLGGIPRLNIPGLRFADGPPGALTRHQECEVGIPDRAAHPQRRCVFP